MCIASTWLPPSASHKSCSSGTNNSTNLTGRVAPLNDWVYWEVSAAFTPHVHYNSIHVRRGVTKSSLGPKEKHNYMAIVIGMETRWSLVVKELLGWKERVGYYTFRLRGGGEERREWMSGSSVAGMWEDNKVFSGVTLVFCPLLNFLPPSSPPSLPPHLTCPHNIAPCCEQHTQHSSYHTL